MRDKQLHPDGHEIGEHDERDEEERRRDPSPAPHASPFAIVEDDPESARVSADTPGSVAVLAVNRAIREAVPGCAIRIGAAAGTTNVSGRASLDISALADGEHQLSALAPDVSEDPVGPGFPGDTSKERVWRPLRGTVRIASGKVVAAAPAEWVKPSGSQMEIRLQPAWMRTRNRISDRPSPPDMITIHHTAGDLPGDLGEFLYNGRVSVHYLVAPSGEVYKMVDDAKVASHAGYSFWQGVENMNGRSIGIEITHKTGVEYPAPQVDAVVWLVRRLKDAFPNIAAGRVVAHSDIGITEPSQRPPIRHGRKSTDPGSAFPWERIEALGLSFQIAAGTVRPGIYGGFFQQVPGGKLIRGDNDASRRYGGQIRQGISGAVRELQVDLERIGYLCRPVDGDYGQITAFAVQMFQQHIFSGTRRRGPDPWNSGDGSLDLATAELLKRVLGEVVSSDQV